MAGADGTHIYGIDDNNIVGWYYIKASDTRHGFLATIPEQPPIVLLSADFDADGDVDGTDFLFWQAGYPTSTGATHLLGDADYDGDVDGIDFLLWQRNYPYPTVLSSVPEPSTLILFISSVVVLTHRRRRIQLGR